MLVKANGIEISVEAVGRGQPLLCLHGFPDHAGIWRRTADALGDEFRVIAPNQRGYHGTTRPVDVIAYETPTLVSDMIGLLDALDIERAAVCGNDWGGLIAGHLALSHPDRVSHLIAINTAHPYALQDLIWDHPTQGEALAYIRQFQLPDADKAFDRSRQDAMIENWYAPQRQAGWMTDADIEEYRSIWSQEGVWAAMLHWYRASRLEVPPPGEPAPSVADRWTAGLSYTIPHPTLVVWGEQDGVFVKENIDRFEANCETIQVVTIPDGGHTPQRSHPDLCAAAIRRFLHTHDAA